jgi:hypothetical protein
MTPAYLRYSVWGAAFAVTFGCASALAFDGEVTSDTAAQFYDVRSPTSEVILNRRRFTTTLGLSGYNLLDTSPSSPKAPDISLRVRLRYDADFGAPSAASDAAQSNSFVAGFSPNQFDLMYGYVEGRRLFGGAFGFKLGRQYVTDVLGWWSFDGGEVSVTTPYYVKAEVYGGLEERGGLALGTSRFEADGIWRGDRSNQSFGSKNLYPAFQPATVAPAVGAAIESTGITWLHARLSYRRVYNTGETNTTDFYSGLYTSVKYDGMRLSTDRLGYAIDGSLKSLGGFKGGFVFDFYRMGITSAFASVDVFAGSKVTVSADYDFYQPWFDADSVFNFFVANPRNNVGLRADVDVDDHISASANAHVRVFTVATSSINPTTIYPLSYNDPAGSGGYPTNGHPMDEGGNLSVRYRTSQTRALLNASGDFGQEGRRVGGDLSAEHVFEMRYVAGLRAGLWDWKDDLRPDRATTSFQYVADVGYRFLPRCQGTVEWEHDINGLVGQRFRLMLLLSLGIGGQQP